jgi:transposase InsO family protein
VPLRHLRHTIYIEPGSPGHNPYVESFNSRMRDEHWNVEEFTTLTEAQILTEQWRIEYNTTRPHSALTGPARRIRREVEHQPQLTYTDTLIAS